MYRIKKEARKFIKSIGELKIDNIEMFLKKYNFVIKYYNKNDDNVLELCPEALTEKGFVYRSDVLRIVYIFKDMSVKERMSTMIHEVGHILLDEEIDSIELKEAKAVLFSEYVFRRYKNKVFT